MANVLIEDNTMTAIGDAIRDKTGKQGLIVPADMPGEIEGIQAGGGEWKQAFAGLMDSSISGEIDISDMDITEIRDYAFQNCKNLTLISLPESITSIGNYAFTNCSNLALKKLPKELVIIGTDAFLDCNNLLLTSFPENITQIKARAFFRCSKIIPKSLPQKMTRIEDYCFYGCTKLALESLPDGLTYIGNEALLGCNITVTSIPKGVTNIGEGAFYDCKSLTNITFEGTPTKITQNVFNACTNLTVINVPWAEDEVENAPWGATNATINYNYTQEV